MKLTPQQLIDLPGAGSAQTQLRKDGRWKKDALELLRDAVDNAKDALDDVNNAMEDMLNETDN